MIAKKEGTTKKIITKKVILLFMASLLLAGLAGWWGIPYAEAARGYSAAGGEYCLILMMGALPWLLQSFISELKEIIYLFTCKDCIDE